MTLSLWTEFTGKIVYSANFIIKKLLPAYGHIRMGNDKIKLNVQSDIIIGNSTYRLIKEIGCGTFGVVYRAKNVKNSEEVAVKVCDKRHTVSNEYMAYEILVGIVGIPCVKWKGKSIIQKQKYNVMVMDLLGWSLEDLFNYCNRDFSLRTVLMLADQMITRLEHVHEHSYIHRDIKSANFVIGKGKQHNRIFLIDFGAAKEYRNEDTQQHISYRTDRKMISTPRFASIRAHEGAELSRRDDLEALGYLLLYFLKGVLPWQARHGWQVPRKEVCNKIYEVKKATSVESLCEDCPDVFVEYLKYCRALTFDGDPDYEYLRKLFRQTMSKYHLRYDTMFDWDFKRYQKRKALAKAASEASR